MTPELENIIETLTETSKQRSVLHRAEKSLTLQMRATCRRLASTIAPDDCYYDGDDEKELNRANGKMLAWMKSEGEVIYKAMSMPAKHQHELAAHALVLTKPLHEARAIIASHRAVLEMNMEDLASKLPKGVLDFAEGVRGVGLMSLANIVGEAGDIGSYANPAKLWKRFGLAVIDGKAQRRVAGDEALKHGFSPSRRAVIWVIGDVLIKQQAARKNKESGETIREAGKYKLVYDKRKAYELARDPEIKPILAHNRAKRYMEKRLIRDFWIAWQRAVGNDAIVDNYLADEASRRAA